MPSEVSALEDVEGDIVIEQTERSYDAGGNLVQVTLRQRFHDDGDTPGPLGDVDTNPKARVTYQAMWPDAIGRVRSTADYGTNGSLALDRPSVAPLRSDTVLVSTTRFASDGQPSAQIGPDGVETRWTNDAAGRRIKLIENYIPEGACASPDGNRTTEYAYTPDSQLSTLTLRNDVTGDQVTRWVYGTTLEDSGVARMDLLRAKIYPESDDTAEPLGDGADEIYERIEYSYNAQGQILTMKDPNGTVHGYDYDELGRLLHDRVTTLADDVDDAVLRISRSYEARGMVAKVTSYDDATVGSGSVVNEVEMLYDAAGNLAEDRQSADGAVDAVTTPAVQYGYATSENLTTRLLSVALVNGAPLSRQYNYRYDASEIDDALGRVSAIGIDGETGDRVAYTYVGAGRVVEVGYPEPDLTLSYIKASGEPVGDAGDPYTGYDRFGRTVDMPWRQGEEGTVVDRFQYGFDRNSNRRWKLQLAAPEGGQDEYYTYDGLQQVRSFERGNVNRNRTAIAAVPVQGEKFDYDPTGNWERYQKSANGASVLDQARTDNRDNQMIEIDGSATGISYDLAGNATLLPPTEGGDWENSYQLVWDAWQRLVTIKSEGGTSTIATYRYDGLFRRLLRTVGGAESQCLYSKQWKALLEWEAGSPDTTRKAYFWGAMHRDELVLRDRDASGSLDERLYVTHDYYHPTAITDASGAVQERYASSAFGVRRVMDTGFATISASAFGWEFAFQGQFRDAESGFYNYGYRYYSSELGRWLSKDPIGERGGHNLYSVLNNRPINFVDKFGLAATVVALLNDAKSEMQSSAIGTQMGLPSAIAMLIGPASASSEDLTSAGGDPQYSWITNTFKEVTSYDKATAIHESTHAYNDQVLSGFQNSRDDEALAYTMQYLYEIATNFQNTVVPTASRFGSCENVLLDGPGVWNRFWDNARSKTGATWFFFGVPNVFTLKDSDFGDVYRIFGVSANCQNIAAYLNFRLPKDCCTEFWCGTSAEDSETDPQIRNRRIYLREPLPQRFLPKSWGGIL